MPPEDGEIAGQCAIICLSEWDAEILRRANRFHAKGKTFLAALGVEIDTALDPMDTGPWIMRGLKTPKPRPFLGKRPNFVEPW